MSRLQTLHRMGRIDAKLSARLLRTGLGRACVAGLLAGLLTACASGPAPEPATQRFEAALHSGSTQFAAGQLQGAAQAFAQAQRVAELYDRRAMRMQALLAQGAVAAASEDPAQALQMYQQAAAEAQGLQDAHAVGVAWAGVADAQRRLGTLDAAQHSYSQALAPGALHEASVERLQARLGQALLWHAQGRSPEAEAALQTLEQQARAAMSPVLPAVLAAQASLLRERGNALAALPKAQEALDLDRRAANPLALAADLELLGRVQAAAQQPAAAQDSWQRALRIVQGTGQTQAAQRLQALLKAMP